MSLQVGDTIRVKQSWTTDERTFQVGELFLVTLVKPEVQFGYQTFDCIPLDSSIETSKKDWRFIYSFFEIMPRISQEEINSAKPFPSYDDLGNFLKL